MVSRSITQACSSRSAAGWLSLFALLASGCFGRVTSAESVRTLPYHASEDTLRSFPRAKITPPAKASVAAAVSFEPFAGYYPLPVGLYIDEPAYNEATKWTPIEVDPAAEVAVKRWFERTVAGGSGPVIRVEGVVTDFEWHMLGALENAGRIATVVTVRDAREQVIFSGQRVTEVRVPFVDALFRVHVGEWLKDPAFLAALEGGAR